MNPTIHLPVEQVAKVVKRHLVTQRESDDSEQVEAGQADLAEHQSDQKRNDDSESIHSTIRNAYKLPGGSIVDGIYKWTANVESERKQRLQRSQSISFPLPPPKASDDALSQRLKQPGGFRRHYVLSRAAKQGRKPPNLWTNSFAEFLCLYGHFGGEDLSDDDEPESNSDEDEEAVIGYGSSVLNEASSSKPAALRRPSQFTRNTDHDRLAIASTSRRRSLETSPLLPRTRNNTAVQGTATPAKAVFLLLKSFVTTGLFAVLQDHDQYTRRD
jgi:proton-coupled amino acid transporter